MLALLALAMAAPLDFYPTPDYYLDAPRELRQPNFAPADLNPSEVPAVAALPAPAKAEPKDDDRAWTARDTVLEALFGLSMLGDYLQTRKITRHADEINPIMGLRGNRVPPELYFPAMMGLHYGTMRLLPSPWRNIAQGLGIAFEGGVVGRNLKLGYGFRF